MNKFSYHIVFGATFLNGRESVAENGPHATATDAVEFALSMMGYNLRVLEVDNKTETRGDFDGDTVLDGFTIERYDGEVTDGNWYLNGGIHQ